MSDKPFFSILLPIKGHPLLLSDALTSLLQQDFGDLEVLVSNNGADPGVKPAIAHLMNDPRVRYMEQPAVLDMPTHFELISKLARGRYLLVLTHRSVLKQHALAEISKVHARFRDEGAVVSWGWDLYYEDSHLLLANKALNGSAAVLDSDQALLNSLSGKAEFPYALPRALNSSVSMDVVEAVRARFGEAFGKINPDFTFAYRCLLLRKSFVHISKALMTSQGFSISNGGTALRGDVRVYLATLGLTDAFKHAPVKAALVENAIVEDFLNDVNGYGRPDLLARWDRSTYYLKCLAEIGEKRAARIVDSAYVDSLEIEVRTALAREPESVQETVKAASHQSVSLGGLIRRIGRRLLGPKTITALRPFLLRLQGATSHKSVLHASGFKD